jgi:hypothetical protein
VTDIEVVELIGRLKRNPDLHYVAPNGLRLKVYRVEFIQAAPCLEGTVRCVWAGGFRLDLHYLSLNDFVDTVIDGAVDELCDKLFSVSDADGLEP